MKILNEDTQNKIIIPANQIKEITLLSVEQAEKLPEYMFTNFKKVTSPFFAQWWWLKDPGNNFSRVRCAETWHKHLGKNGNSVDSIYAVRPVLEIERFNFSNIKVSDVVDCLGLDWYYIGNNLLLCKSFIGEAQFNRDYAKPDANQFEGSDVQKWLLDWLQEKKVQYSNFLIQFDNKGIYSNDKENAISIIKEEIDSGYTGHVTIINQVTGVVKELDI